MTCMQRSRTATPLEGPTIRPPRGVGNEPTPASRWNVDLGDGAVRPGGAPDQLESQRFRQALQQRQAVAEHDRLDVDPVLVDEAGAASERAKLAPPKTTMSMPGRRLSDEPTARELQPVGQ
jgi:hypothetical protein